MLTALFVILVLTMLVSFFSNEGNNQSQEGASADCGLVYDYEIRGQSRAVDLFEAVDALRQELCLPEDWDFSGVYTYAYSYDIRSGLTELTCFETTHGLDREEEETETRYLVCQTLPNFVDGGRKIILLPADQYSPQRIDHYMVKFSRHK